jgi:hypothetical protein
MDNNKKSSKKGSKPGPSFSNDQLGENEIDKVSAEGYKDVGNKKKKK